MRLPEELSNRQSAKWHRGMCFCQILFTEGVTAGELLIPALLGRWALLHLAAKFYLKVHFAIWQLWGRGGGGGGDADGDGDGRVGENIY